MRDPYTILGVDRSASQKDIKNAFRKMAKKYHPDQNPDNPKAKERFAEANSAYEIVGDKKKRGQFDRGEIDPEGKEKFAGFGGQHGAPGGDPFAGMRRGGQGNPFGGNMGGAEDILKEMFGASFAGAQARSTGGFGGMHGQTQRQHKAADFKLKAIARVEDLARGKTQVMFPDGRKISISIPPEAKDGQVIRLKGQGEQHPGAQPGDALVMLVFRAGGRFEAKGVDLRSDVMVPLATAVKGGKIAVETLDGKISLAIPPWTTSGKIFRLKGRGLPTKAKGMGDLLVRVMIELPDERDEGLADLFNKK